MWISPEFFSVYQKWLAIAEEYMITDEEELALIAQWVFNAQKEEMETKMS